MLLPDLSKLTLTISAKRPTRSDRLAAKQKAVELIRQLGKSRKTDEITQLIALLEQIVNNNISEDVEREIQDLNLPQGVTSARKNAIEFLKELVNVKERNVPKKKNTSASPQIVGRSTDIFQGVVEHSFLVFYPGRATEKTNELSKYKWWTEEMMTKNGTLNNLLNSWLVANGNSLEDPDPRDRGWARKIIAKRISNRRQEYIVQWHSDENVPERAAQNRLGGRQTWEWKRRNQLLSGKQVHTLLVFMR